MEFKQIDRLFGKTEEELQICRQKIESWTKFMNDYKALEERLSTLADKTTHEVMVPIAGSKLAFMSGYIKHTNEILVLLGDNYLVQRSAKQANDIVGRRVEKCRKMLSELRAEKAQLEKWLTFSQQFADENQSQDFVEIVEELDEKAEQLWRTDHRRRVREQKLSERMATKESDDSEIMKKLDKLEIEENLSQKPKSILKKDVKRTESLASNRETSVGFDVNKPSEVMATQEDNIDVDSEVMKSKEQSNEIAFKNEIKERDISQDINEDIGQMSVEIKSSPKIVSRFKANRMKK